MAIDIAPVLFAAAAAAAASPVSTCAAAVAAAPRQPLEARLEALKTTHLDAVMAIENAAYPYPWSRRNFSDSLQAQYYAQILLLTRGAAGAGGTGLPDGNADDALDLQLATPATASAPAPPATPIGYFLAMQGVDEVHLLNITVAPAYQGQGWSLVMLDALALWAGRQPGIQWLWLEVRPSNHRARTVYERYGFKLMGRRRNYYPAGPAGSANAGIREDALVMSRSLR